MKAPIHRTEFDLNFLARLKKRGGGLPYSSPGGHGNVASLELDVYPCHYKTGESLEACGADKTCATCGSPATQEAFRYSGDGGRTWATKYVIRCIGRAHAWPASNMIWRDQKPCPAFVVHIPDGLTATLKAEDNNKEPA